MTLTKTLLEPFTMHWLRPNYLRQEVMYGNRRSSVCLSVCLSISNFAQQSPDLMKISEKNWHWASKQMITFWWRSGSWIHIGLYRCGSVEGKFSGKVGNGNEQTIKILVAIRIRTRIRIATLVRRALAEVCTASVLLVVLVSINFYSRYELTNCIGYKI